jgi:outer membrane protein OmpA-like peptidoglycan-associated protein
VHQPERFKTTKFGPYWFCSLAPTFQDGKGTEKDMTRKYGKIAGYLVLVCCLAAGSLYGRGDGDKVKIKGLITTRTGETLTVKTQAGSTVTVVLTDDTKVQQPKGLGLRKKQMSAAVLIPGLQISVDGVGDAQSQVTASTINFNQDDLQLAETIQAGLTPTQQQVQSNQQKIKANQKDIQANQQGIQANQQGVQKNAQQIGANQEQIAANMKEIEDTTKRFTELSEYEVKGDATVNFAVASSIISASDKDALTKLAHDAVNLTGYIIEVKGYADSSGNAAMNQTLSMDRAQAVIAYLMQVCNVPVRHIVAPGAMGTSDPTATNETAQGRAENRRVEVKVLVNRGLAGK